MSATTGSLKLPAVVNREAKSEEPKKTTVEPEITEQKAPWFKRSAIKAALLVIVTRIPVTI